MKKQYHILNGDSLLEQIPESIEGIRIVARECLVDGPVRANSLTEFYHLRANFLSDQYEVCTEEEYWKKTVPEINKILEIPDDGDINLWFEDDLFCQVNFWFTINLLGHAGKTNALYLVRPTELTPYGFAGVNESELISLFNNKTQLTETDKLSRLWDAYKADDMDELLGLSVHMENTYPFIKNAVKAQIARISTNGKPGRPKQSLLEIMKALDTDKFGPVFREFCRREYVYGFGDLQVRRLFDELQGKK